MICSDAQTDRHSCSSWTQDDDDDDDDDAEVKLIEDNG